MAFIDRFSVQLVAGRTIRFTWVLSAQNADTMIDNPLAGRNISCRRPADPASHVRTVSRVTRSTARY